MRKRDTSFAAEQAVAADHFAREIVCILTVFLARSRRLIGKPFGGFTSAPASPSTFFFAILPQSELGDAV
jgi:hypothetical protein